MWTDPTITLPANGQTVYIRRLLYGSMTPLDAVFVSAGSTFTCPNGLSLPWYFVARWKPR